MLYKIWATGVDPKTKHVANLRLTSHMYWQQNRNKQGGVINTHNIFHTCLDVSIIKYVSDIPHSIFSLKNHGNMFKDRHHIIIIFYMKLCSMIILSTKDRNKMIIIKKYLYTKKYIILQSTCMLNHIFIEIYHFYFFS